MPLGPLVLRALAVAGLLPMLLLAAPAEAKGCIKGAIVGGAVGHVAGKHGVAGAAAGCAVGHHRATVKERENAAAQNDANENRDTTANARDTAANTRDTTANTHAAATRREKHRLQHQDQGCRGVSRTPCHAAGSPQVRL